MPNILSVVQGATNIPVSSKALVAILSSLSNINGDLFIGCPIVGGADGKYTIDAILISQQYGIIVFDLVEGTDPSNYTERQDDAANKLV